MRTAHRIAVDPARLDLSAPTPLDRIIQADDEWSRTSKGVDQQFKQDPAGGSAIPTSAVQNAMVVLKVIFASQAYTIPVTLLGSSSNGIK